MVYHERTWEEEQTKITQRTADFTPKEKILYLGGYMDAMRFRRDSGDLAMRDIPHEGIDEDSLNDLD